MKSQQHIAYIRQSRAWAPLLIVAASCTAATNEVAAPNELDLEPARSSTQDEVRHDPKPFIWGVNGHPGIQMAYAPSGEGLRRQLRYVRRLGATHYRVDIYPDSLGREPFYFDGVAKEAARLGVTILPVLIAHPKAHADTLSNYLLGRAIGLRFAMRHRGQFTHVEAGNELELPTLRFTIDTSQSPPKVNHWEGFSLDNYVDSLLRKTTAFLRGMTDGIHQGSPGTKVIINGAWRHFGYFEALKRDGVDFDVYGYHWYSEMGDFSQLVLPHLPADKDIWITEGNRRNSHVSRDHPAEQAEWVGQFSRQLVRIPRVKAFFVYELYNQPAYGDDPESKYGLIDCSDKGCRGPRTIKPAFHAYRAAIAKAK
jgi:hypothetical protein